MKLPRAQLHIYTHPVLAVPLVLHSRYGGIPCIVKENFKTVAFFNQVNDYHDNFWKHVSIL